MKHGRCQYRGPSAQDWPGRPFLLSDSSDVCGPLLSLFSLRQSLLQRWPSPSPAGRDEHEQRKPSGLPRPNSTSIGAAKAAAAACSSHFSPGKPLRRLCFQSRDPPKAQHPALTLTNYRTIFSITGQEARGWVEGGQFVDRPPGLGQSHSCGSRRRS